MANDPIPPEHLIADLLMQSDTLIEASRGCAVAVPAAIRATIMERYREVCDELPGMYNPSLHAQRIELVMTHMLIGVGVGRHLARHLVRTMELFSSEQPLYKLVYSMVTAFRPGQVPVGTKSR